MTYGVAEEELHTFLTSVLDEGYRSASRPAALPPVLISQEAGKAPQPDRTRWRDKKNPFSVLVGTIPTELHRVQLFSSFSIKHCI